MKPVGGRAATRIIARASLRALLRTRAFWLSGGLLALPVVLAPIAAAHAAEPWPVVMEVLIALLAVVVPLHLAPAVADEVEEQTFTYLWSRPIPRYAVGLGRYLALAPLVVLGFVGALVAAYALVAARVPLDPALLWRGGLALVLGVLATSAVALGVGALVPRQSQAAAIAFLALVDLAVGAIPVSVASLSVTRHVRALSGVADAPGALAVLADPPSFTASVLWILGIGGAWLGTTLWRLSRVQYAGRKTAT